jgi:cytochrome c oxidase subunit 1
MAVSEAPPATLESPFRRPTSTSGIVGWLTTVDHKKIGILYGVTALLFFVAGGIEALLIRLQLAQPDGTVLSSQAYSQMFTMHGITMIFLVVMPLGAAFFNYMIPLMIGARDVAFPRLNAFSYWVFLAGGLFIYSSWFFGAPDAGWFSYANLSTQGLPAVMGTKFYALGLQIVGIASLIASVNFVTTIINLRAPGMSFFKMPMFIWMALVVNFLLLFAMPVIAVALFQLMFDTMFGTNFFNPSAGGDPILWQHMFWLFGHPEVYILILPAMGIVSEVLPTFSRKPLFGYAFVAFSGIAIGFMGWGVWAHHMFAAGLGPVANSAFALSTMFIAVPTGVKIFNWLGTVWGGKIRLTTSMLMSIGFVTMFIIGGLSGVTHAIVPADYQQTDTYYIVAHFHYVLFGGAIFGLFSGIYYWWPKITGKLLDERTGKVHFVLMFIGFNLTFGPMHITGLQGQPRRYYKVIPGQGHEFWNLVETYGAFTIALSMVVFVVNVLLTQRRGKAAGNDPWDARTLEWSIPSPPPHYNFAEIPNVKERDDWWHRKYTEDESGKPVPVVAGGQSGDESPQAPEDQHEEHAEPHMPKPSYWPLVASTALPLLGYGLLFQWILIPVGVVTLLVGIYGWALEPVE